MARFQELCRVRICWLKPGDLCLESKLGLNEYAERNVIARFEGEGRTVYQHLNNEMMLAAMLDWHNRCLLEGGYSRQNPPVQVLVPVTIYEFDVAVTTEGWLASEMMEGGAIRLFGDYLQELEETGKSLRDSGRTIDRGSWGLSVCFHTLWVFHAGAGDSQDEVTREFAGPIDLNRVPLSLFVQSPRPQELAESGLGLARC